MGLSSKNNGRGREELRQLGVHLRTAQRNGSPKDILVEQAVFIRSCVNISKGIPEPDVCDTAWFSYRYLTAFARTDLFVKALEEAARSKYAQYVDGLAAQNYKPTRGFLYETQGVKTSLWKARQKIDSLGIPYHFFSRVAIDTAMQWMKYKQIPRPNQLLTDEMVDEHRR